MLVRASTVGAAAILLVIAVASQAVRFLPPSFRLRPRILSVLDEATLVSVGIVALLAALVVAATVLVSRRPDWHEERAPEEEPLLTEPSSLETRSCCALIGCIDWEPGAGASTVAFNLAVVTAAEGLLVAKDRAVRRPRPLCLLSEGVLTEALGLDPGPLERHLGRHSGLISEDLAEVTTRHHAGCELLCIPRGRVARHQLRLLRLALGRHYDLVVVDAACADNALREGVEDTADVLVAVTLPTLRSAEAATRLLQGVGRGRRLATTMLLINRARADTQTMELALGFAQLAAFPHEPFVAEADLRAAPWSLAPDGACRQVLLRFARRLLPELFVEASDAVAV